METPDCDNNPVKFKVVLPSDAGSWWEQRRLRYNVGLVIAGLLAFACYVVVVDRGISLGRMPGAEISLFTTAFQAVGYILMIGVANICYLAGPFCESLIKPRNVDRYRRLTFQVGFWFSLLLPFTIPALITWTYLIHPSTDMVK